MKKHFKKLKLDGSKRYRRFVPKEVRQLGESHRLPKPERYIPSAQGRGTHPDRVD
jgi:hypothetical protein